MKYRQNPMLDCARAASIADRWLWTSLGIRKLTNFDTEIDEKWDFLCRRELNKLIYKMSCP